MPITSKTFVRSTALLLLVGLLALIGIVGTNIWLADRSQVYLDEVIEARIARRAAVDLRASLLDMESGQRGYLLALDESYLDPYEEARPVVLAQIDALNDVLAPYEVAAEPLQQLETDVAFKVDEMDQTIAQARAGNVTDAIARVRTDQGQQAMGRIMAFIDGLIEAVDERLIEGVGNQRSTGEALRMVAIVGGLIILMVVAGAIWAVLNYTQELAKARRAVEQANTSLEERVRERTADLGKANEEIQRFAYIVTHDLRAPLVNIMGFTAELETSVEEVKAYMDGQEASADDPVASQARLAATEDLPEAITFIRAATRKMDGLINAILKISREGRRQLKPEPVELAEIVETSANAVHHQVADGDGTIETDIRVGQLITDRLSLEQILGNMLDNAIKYQEPERPLRVDIRARHVPGNRVVIEVQDNGRGIADTDHERVFELFRRSGSQNNPGEGIGLAHVRTMVRSLGGDVTLTSQLGEGTTFIINLPRDSRGFLGRLGA